MDTELKVQVLQLFLNFVQKFVPFQQAIVATLGGLGKESALWKTAGVLDRNGWLIERNRQHSRRIIQEAGYHYTTSLKNFWRVFRSVNGDKAGVDAFHLDLCGTIEPNVRVARRLVPLVLKSKGRCFAITVADARRNLSLEDFRTVEKSLQRMLGFRYERLKSKLKAEQGSDRDAAVMRELGFFYSIVSLFCFYGRYALPDRVVRVSYISNYSGSHFPMRTYFFHFKSQPQRMKPSQFVVYLYQQWFRNALNDLDRPQQERARTGRATMTKKAVQTSGEKRDFQKDLGMLRKLAEAVGLDYVIERLQLNGASKTNQFITTIETALAAFKGTPKPEPAEASGDTKVGRKVTENGEKTMAKLELLRARAQGKAEYDRVKLEIGQRFRLGRPSKKGAAATSRALLATTQKHGRPEFLKSLAKQDATLINEELAGIYKVPVEQLRREAGL